MAWLTVGMSVIAPASVPAAPTVYGGEIGPDRASFALQLNPGDELNVGRVVFDLQVSCPGYDRDTDISDALPLVSPLIRPQRNALFSGPVTAGGDWSATGYVSYELGSDYSLGIDERIEGAITGTVASGTFRAQAKLYSLRPGKPDIECRPARYKWNARSAPGRIFAGATADRRPVVIEVAEDGNRVRRARIAGAADCRGGYWSLTSSVWRSFALDRDGRFAVSKPYSFRSGRVRHRGREAIAGTISGTTVRGRFSDRWTERDAKGNTDRCATGSVRYTARTTPSE